MARPNDRDQPYANHPMPGEHTDDSRSRPVARKQAEEEHAWSDPTSWYGEGGYHGLGPKGYVRTDGRIRDYVCDDLMDDPWIDASAVEVAVQDGEVTLTGTVDSDDARRLAEDVAAHAGGVKRVRNALRVVARQN